jgi:hypothetical protein
VGLYVPDALIQELDMSGPSIDPNLPILNYLRFDRGLLVDIFGVGDWVESLPYTDIKHKNFVCYDSESWQQEIVSKRRFRGKKIYTGADIWVNPDKRE